MSELMGDLIPLPPHILVERGDFERNYISRLSYDALRAERDAALARVKYLERALQSVDEGASIVYDARTFEGARYTVCTIQQVIAAAIAGTWKENGDE